MTLDSDPNQDGFDVAGEPNEPDADAAILAEYVPDDINEDDDELDDDLLLDTDR